MKYTSKLITSLAFGIACALYPACTSTFAGRYVFWNYPTVQDHLRFPTRRLAPGGRPAELPIRLQPIQALIASDVTLWRPASGDADRSLTAANFESFVARNETQSLLIARDNTIVYEEYFNGARRESLMAAFSISKSVVSMLVHLALARGEFESLDEPLERYIRELRGDPKGAIPLRDLLNMTSGIRFNRTIWPWSDSVRSYHSVDLRGRLLAAEVEAPPGQRWLYSEYNPPLLAWALERVSDSAIEGARNTPSRNAKAAISGAASRGVAERLETEIWSRVMAGEARWLMDDPERQVELAHAGLYARARDYLRLGLLFQNDGVLGARRVLPPGMARKSTTLRADDPDVIRAVPASFAPGRYAYKNAWWLPLNEAGRATGDIIASGLLGQFIYVSPARRLVIVRTGFGRGELESRDWFKTLERLAAEIDRSRSRR